eukprot:scaffold422001_cov21-Prasinocladus_malaysianus.AAC.1
MSSVCSRIGRALGPWLGFGSEHCLLRACAGRGGLAVFFKNRQPPAELSTSKTCSKNGNTDRNVQLVRALLVDPVNPIYRYLVSTVPYSTQYSYCNGCRDYSYS